MAQRQVLSVGQCGFDHGNITRFLTKAFRVRVLGADSFDEALSALRTEPFDLVLVNRVSDLDGAPGVDLVRQLKADPALAGIPVMLVSDVPEAQQSAEVLGALPGFGKSGLRSEQTLERLRPILADA